MQTRYYDPEVGRFISQDSVEYADPTSINGLNLYAYCGNNPVMYVDPTGTKMEWWNWLAVALAIVGTVLVVTAITLLTAGVGTTVLAGTMAGAILYGASVGTLIGAGIGITAGGIIGGAVSGWTAEGILTGMGIGFGGGAIIGAIIGGTVGGISYAKSTTTLYRAVDVNEYNSIKTTGKFSLKEGAMESKQFGLKLNEVRNYAKLDFNKGIYSNIVKVSVPNSIVPASEAIDVFVFKSGVVTFNSAQLGTLNNWIIYLSFLGI